MKENEKSKYQTAVSHALDRVWERLLEPSGMAEFENDSLNLQRNRQIRQLAELTDSLKIVLLTVRITTWKSLLMAVRIWNRDNFTAKNEDLTWDAQSQVTGAVIELMAGGLIGIEDELDAALLAEKIAERGDAKFVDAPESVFEACTTDGAFGDDELEKWKESQDWDGWRTATCDMPWSLYDINTVKQ